MHHIPLAVRVGITYLIAMALGSMAFSAMAAPSARTVLYGHLSPAVARASVVGQVAPASSVSLALVLPLRHQAELNTLISRLYDPQDPDYGHYLTPSEFTAQYAPTAAEYARVAAYAEAQGFTVTGTHANRLLLDISGPAAAAEQAFAVRLEHFVSPQGRLFRAPDTDPSISAAMAGSIAAVVGLDTASVRHPHLQPAISGSTIGSGPGGGLSPTDIKAAYGLSGVSLNGSGQTLAVFELDGYTASDITAYENKFGLRQVPLENILVDGASGVPSRGRDSGADEVTLDIEMQIALAPGANQILVYEGANSDQAILDTYDRIATDDQAKEISSCWGSPEDQVSTATLDSENTIFTQMAAQGQSIFAASGDNGAYDDGSTLSVDDPSSQPEVTGVGGTTLTLSGAGGTWRSETTWDAGSPQNGASGGGISSLWPIPTYQQGAITSASLGSQTMRNSPDVALDSDPDTGFAIYYAGNWSTFGGTSCAAPLWAAFTALVNQQRAANGLGDLGFANPAIYNIGLGRTGSYASDFHDIADSSDNLYYPAVAGFDDATGWGTMIGTPLLADLASGTGGTVSAPSAPTNLSAAPGNAEVSLTWTASSGAASYAIYRSTVNGGPYSVVGTTANFPYTDMGLANGTTYYYVVTASDSGGTSAYSAQTSAVPAAPATGSPPAAPTDLVATAGNAQVALTWTGSVGATNYLVYRSASGATAVEVAAVNATSFTDTSLTNGTTYTYTVTADNSSGQSGMSNAASATPTAPTVVTSPSDTVTLAAGWNLISLPYSNPSESLTSLFGFSPATLFVWNPTTLAYSSSATSLQLGVGYWIYAPESVTLHPSGSTASTGSDISVALAPGWNQIGDPFVNNTALNDMSVTYNGATTPFASAVSAGEISGVLFSYNTSSGTYTPLEAGGTLSPNVGYWVYSFDPVVLEIAPQ